jgi:hypothetical protein
VQARQRPYAQLCLGCGTAADLVTLDGGREVGEQQDEVAAVVGDLAV